MQWQPYAYLYSVWSQFVSSTPPIGTPASVAVDAVNVYEKMPHLSSLVLITCFYTGCSAMEATRPTVQAE